MSAKTVRAPVRATEPAVAKKVKGVVIGDYPDGDYRTDDAVQYVGSHAIGLCPNSSG